MANSTRRNLRVLGAAAAFVGAGALSVAMAAPSAAAVDSVEITTPSGYGSTAGVYGPGCSYEVEAVITSQAAGDSVKFEVTKGTGAPTELETVEPTLGKGTVSTTWKPTEPGSYKITATQNSVSASTKTLTVGTFAIQNDSLSDGTCVVVIP
ncbi:hypothetical protein ABLE92_02645 [Gordonia sp. VNQ95]|uniref:hypothetical protein n=1 Tax=Gordonia sp. VNQ95 TaxID=3156619 RepID=UPI0032B510A7